MLYNFEGFETCGTEIGIANEATTRPRIILRCDEAKGHGGVPATDSFFLIDDKDSEGYAIQMGSNNFSNGNFIAWNIPAGDQTTGTGAKTFIVGCLLHVPSATRDCHFMTVRSDANNDTHLYWSIIDSTDLRCYLAVVGTIDIELDVFTPGSWHYVEMKFSIHNTLGLVEAYVDGVLAFSHSNIDTRNFWGTVDQFRFNTTVASSGEDYIGFDNIYLLKTEGDDPVTYLGASITVISLPPDADDTVEWTTSTGLDHYALVDENGADSSDYVETAVDTEEEMFTITDLATAGDYYGVKVEVEAIDTDVGANNMDVRIDSGGTIDETNYNVTDTVNYAVFTYVVGADDPDTSSAWTTAAIDALKIGAQFNT